jgi:hypothetical protein
MQEFKLIVAGGRDFNDYDMLTRVIFDLANNEYKEYAVSIVTGMARGADNLGYLFSIKHGIVKYCFPAEWKRYGKRAGFIRNEQMGNFADGLLAFWDEKSSGTKNMIHYMGKLNKPVHIVTY